MVRLTSMAVAILIGIAPMAQAATCTEQMEEVNKLINAAVETPKKEQAIKYMEEAKEALAKKDESGCMTHAQAAKESLKGGP